MTDMPAVQSRHDELVAQGREALLAGDKAHAHSLLTAAVELDPRSEEAWIWLSGAQSSLGEMAACLQRVLEINPRNQQAQEGLQWIAAQETPAPPSIEAHTASQPAPRVNVRRAGRSSYGMSLLFEAAVHPFAAGAFLGLLRLVGWLRPTTLSLLRTEGGPIGVGGSVGLVLATALTHGAALLVLWLLIGFQLSHARGDGLGDRFDSLVRAGHKIGRAHV